MVLIMQIKIFWIFYKQNKRVINPYNKNKYDVKIDINVFANEYPDK